MWSQFLQQRSIAILIQCTLARRDRVLSAKNIGIVSSRPDWPLRSFNAVRELARQKIQEAADRAKRRAEERARIDAQ